MSPLTICRELHGDLCERNLSHNPHLKLSDEIHNRSKFSDSNNRSKFSDSNCSEISEKSMLLLALVKRRLSLRRVAASNRKDPVAGVVEASLVAWVGKNKGWIGLEKKERRLEELQ